MKNYFVVTLLQTKKYKLYAQHDPASDVLTVSKIEHISNTVGLYSKERLFKEIEIVKKNGYQVLVETRNEKAFRKLAPLIVLNERGDENRLHQDIYYEYFKAMFQAQELDVGEDLKSQVDVFAKRVAEVVDEKTGRVTYKFRKFDNELRAIVLLVAAHVHPPKGLGYFQAIEREMQTQAPPKSRVERIKFAVGIGWDRKVDEDWDKRIEETQAKFTY